MRRAGETIAAEDVLHDLGFKVTLWVTPFAEAASETYREGAALGYYVTSHSATPASEEFELGVGVVEMGRERRAGRPCGVGGAGPRRVAASGWGPSEAVPSTHGAESEEPHKKLERIRP